MQSFFNNVYVDEVAIHYTESFVYDYWNEAAYLARGHAVFIQNLETVLAPLYTILGSLLGAALEAVLAILEDANAARVKLSSGFVSPVPGGLSLSDGSTSYVDVFGTPVNLLRFKFEVGTVFKVTIQSWAAEVTEEGLSTGNPEVAEPYDTSNPNGNQPAPSGGRAPAGYPYGLTPPPQSPRNPTLDPNDYSNAPDPNPGGGTVDIQGWQITAIAGVQSAGYAVGCPAGSLAESIPSLAGIQNPINLGVKPVRVDAQGRVSASDVLAAYPGFQFNTHFFAADTSCGVNGTADF